MTPTNAMPTTPQNTPTHVEHVTRGGGFSRILVAVILAGVVGYVALQALSVYRETRLPTSVTVKGSAKQTIESDRVVWDAYVTTRDPELGSASTKLEDQVKRVKAFVAQAKIPADAVTEMSVNTMTETKRDVNGNYTNEIEYYIVSQTVHVESTEVDKVEALSRDITALTKEGIEVTSSSPQFIITDLTTYRLDLLKRAAADGQQRAQALAEKAGGRLGGLQDARMGVFQILPQYSVDVEDYGSNDTSSKMKDAMAVVTLTYGLK